MQMSICSRMTDIAKSLRPCQAARSTTISIPTDFPSLIRQLLFAKIMHRLRLQAAARTTEYVDDMKDISQDQLKETIEA